MSAIRLPLLYAFAGGCLSSALLFGVWQAGAASGAAAAKQQQRIHHVELVSAAQAAPSDEPHPAPATGVVVEGTPSAAPGSATSPATPDPDTGGPTAADSATVSDVLTRLETAYRERVASAAPAPPPSTEPRLSAAPPASAAPEAPEPSAPPVAAVAPVAAPAEPPPAVAVAVAPVAPLAPPAAAAVAGASVAPPEPPQFAAAPAFVPPDAPPPTEIHYGDVNQNTYITNVRQGDVYLIQMQQQLAMLQYMQLLGMSGAAAQARNGRGAPAQRTAFPSTITNPDNPWGFNFKPPHLVH